ncbi:MULTISPECIES: ABC transporter ATP-binding protein [unclassified Fusibacter]|uniref:ABC transporter ATP-binding protein n=1 Tax=unclassified Fusibacter TaxID=2624464 RepID=UPI00101358BF|nr:MULTISPECIES: ABC transporter ATP-binding protein [unclassified Fusibacter]MCK8060119.1 ABC transporter ATP-binding protein [Fusibacter sp. A2]NPE22261.1 ABC transporter ATP-binding protein [Fusibacter sp. A1]RXV61035.1 ABC transporter ATP-binding protein [Fusibacter sp. A1]
MIRLNEISKTYQNGKVAVNHLNVTIEKGEIFGFIGPNGAGKTTTLKMITGILAPTNGSILIGESDIAKNPIEAKMQFTFVPDHPEIYDGIKGINYLNFIADMYEVGIEDRKERIERFSKAFQIDDALGQHITTYSHGMRQKLMICAALLPKPKIFILDEPHVGLDPQSSKVLKDLMREHRDQGGTVLFSSHVLEVVENLCDRVAIIHKGELIACDTLEAIKANREISLEDLFLEMTKDE